VARDNRLSKPERKVLRGHRLFYSQDRRRGGAICSRSGALHYGGGGEISWLM